MRTRVRILTGGGKPLDEISSQGSASFLEPTAVDAAAGVAAGNAAHSFELSYARSSPVRDWLVDTNVAPAVAVSIPERSDKLVSASVGGGLVQGGGDSDIVPVPSLRVAGSFGWAVLEAMYSRYTSSFRGVLPNGFGATTAPARLGVDDFGIEAGASFRLNPAIELRAGPGLHYLSASGGFENDGSGQSGVSSSTKLSPSAFASLSTTFLPFRSGARFFAGLEARAYFFSTVDVRAYGRTVPAANTSLGLTFGVEFMALIASVAGCFNSSSYTPVLTSSSADPGAGLQPGLIPTGSTQIFVFGYFLSPDTTVYLDGRPQRTAYLAAPHPELAAGSFFGAGTPLLQVDLAAEATNVFGSLLLTAMGDGSLMSAPLRVTVVDALFRLTGIAPKQIASGSPATTLVLTGTGFNASSQVFWNGNSLTTTFVSSTSISAVVPAPLLAVAGDATVEIREKSCRDSLFCETGTRSGICTVGTARALVVVPGRVTGLAWDATHALLFAVIQQPSGTYVLTTIDTQTGATGASVDVETSSDISVSAGDRFIYVANNMAKRYSLPGLTDEIAFTNLRGTRVVAAPDAPETAAFAQGNQLRVLDGTSVRPNTAQAFFEESIVWGFDISRIYGISTDAAGVQAYAVDVAGVTAGAPLGWSRFPINNDLAFDRVRRRLYAGGGENVDEQGLDSRPFAIAAADQCKLAVDPALGKAFFACAQYGAGLTVRSFDLQTQQQISTLVLSKGDLSTVLGAIRWGSDGLAIAVGSRLYLYSGQFVR